MKKGNIIFIGVAVVLIIIGIIILANRNKGNENNKGGNNPAASAQSQNISSGTEYVETLEDGTKINTSNELKKEKQFQGLTVKNIQITNQNGKTQILADIENKTSQDKEAMLVDVILYDKNKNVLTTLGGRISPIKAGKTMQFSTTAMIDYTNVYDFEFKLK